jgi:hypothetical protein
LVEDNRLLVFVHGHYLPAEISDETLRYRLLQKLFSPCAMVEVAVAEVIATTLAVATGLPPVEYPPGDVAVRVGDNPYVYARNLAANRLYDGPVVYLEPYYMNNRMVYQRFQAGDYAGERLIGGRAYRSIFREYAEAVAEGVIAYYGAAP